MYYFAKFIGTNDKEFHVVMVSFKFLTGHSNFLKECGTTRQESTLVAVDLRSYPCFLFSDVIRANKTIHIFLSLINRDIHVYL